MNKFILRIVIFSFLTQSIFSYQFTLGDDLLAMNLFAPIENARTFNFFTTTPLIFGFDLDLNYSLFTNNINSSRVDEASILLKYPIDNFDIINITTSLGFTLTGDLSGSDVNETINKIFNQEYNSLLTEEEQINIYFIGQIIFNKLSNLFKSDKNSTTLQSNVFSKIEIITNYTISANIGSSLIFSGNNFSTNIGYSYGYLYNFTDFETVNYVKNLEDEGKVNLTITAGSFQYDLDLFIDGSFSTGKYSLIFGPLPKGPELSSIDLKVTPGTEYDIGSGIFLSTLQIDFLPFKWELSRIELELKSVYGDNSPNFFNNDLNIIYYTQTYYNKLTIGGNFSLFENTTSNWFNPYIGLGIGYENYRYYYDSDLNNVIPIYELRAGFNILLPHLFVNDNIKYGLSSNITFRDSLNEIKYKNKLLLNLGLLIVIEL